MYVKNDKGFSIVQGLVLAGLLSGTALVTAKLVSDQKKAAISVESKDAIDELATHALTFLQLADNCRQTLIGNGAAAVAGVRNINHLYVVNKTSQDLVSSVQPFYSVGKTYFGNTVKIQGMSINYGSGNLGDLTPATLDIRLRRNDSKDPTARTKDGFGSKDFTKNINIIVQRNVDGTFRSCYAIKPDEANTAEAGNRALMRDFCDKLNTGMSGQMFVWNNTTNTCNLQHNVCPGGQFFTGITSSGTITDLNGIHYSNTIPAQPIGYDYSARSGINSVGLARCRAPIEAINLGKYIDTTLRNCVNRTGVRFYKVSSQRVGITCN